MKICAVIAEYNPFHNGHLYHLEEIKKSADCDTLLVIMSGNFTQRGEIAIMNKYKRAKHAIYGGADIVIELPTVFATANAEIFARGAVQILSQIPEVKVLSFGCETGDRQDFLDTAKAISYESKEFKSMLKEELKLGKSYARARVDILKQLKPEGAKLSLLESPNSILGLEYTKAILSQNASIDILPIKRIGSGYKDEKIKSNFSSASAIRAALNDGKNRKAKKNIPSYVFKDIKKVFPSADDYIFYSLIMSEPSYLAQISDCSEGLENRIKALIKDSRSLDELLDKIVTKRYTKARIRRICLSAFLKINNEMITKAQNSDLYVKVLAVAQNRMDILTTISATSKYPLITRKNDYKNLTNFMIECFEKDVLCNDIYNFLSKEKTNEYIMPIVK